MAAILGGISALLWFCAFFEARHLGPLTIDASDSAMEPVPALSVVETIQTAA